MKTIEERAKKYALQFEQRYQVAMFKAYIDGATDERELLIDKACEFIYSELAEGNLSCNDDIESILERLKKAMKQ